MFFSDKNKEEHDEDSDYLPVESLNRRNSESDEDFKPTKISPRPSTSRGRKIDRRVLSSDEETTSNKCEVWCEIYVEELEQWISVDVIKGKVHCTSEIYVSNNYRLTLAPLFTGHKPLFDSDDLAIHKVAINRCMT